MASATSEVLTDPAVATVADACLISAQRLIEWVSRAPTMEEDVAVANLGLDLLGQARALLGRLGDEDQLAYFRDAEDWHHPVICELPNGDFGHTMLRLLFVETWLSLEWRDLLRHDDPQVRGAAERALKENAYHLRHASAWVVRLGDGTAESHTRMLAALDALWPHVGALGRDGWHAAVASVLTDATLPVRTLPRSGDDTASRRGASPSHRRRPTPDLVELLAEMQSLARAHPGVTW